MVGRGPVLSSCTPHSPGLGPSRTRVRGFPVPGPACWSVGGLGPPSPAPPALGYLPDQGRPRAHASWPRPWAGPGPVAGAARPRIIGGGKLGSFVAQSRGSRVEPRSAGPTAAACVCVCSTGEGGTLALPCYRLLVDI